MFDPSKKENKATVKYFSDKKAIILDPNGPIRIAIKKMLIALGMKPAEIIIVDSKDKAQTAFKKEHPEFVFAAHQLKNDALGTDLLDPHLQIYPNRLHAGFYLISAANYMSSVCAVLDQEIDGFISKPFTLDSLFNTLLGTVQHKITPSQFTQDLEKGKELILTGKLDDALNMVQSAQKLKPKSANPLYWEGLIHQKRSKMDEAISCYKTGLTKNPIHYKCLSALSEIYFENKSFDLSYQLTSTLVKHYPLNPTKLPNLMRLSIINKKYDDLVTYTEKFHTLAAEDDNVEKNISAALAICGQFFLSINEVDKAESALTDSAIKSGGSIEILRNVCSTLAKNNKYKKAISLLEQNTTSQTDDKEFKTLQFELLYLSNKFEQAALSGMKIVGEGIHTPKIFEMLIYASIQANRKKSNIEDIIFEAIRLYPDNQDRFNQLLQLIPLTMEQPQN
ncbi:MAG: hypothetical protein ISR65_07015 [Bacteriovoracaceae bacterium]|nr:hypothetical protein [Bacteriovoracaceae bacterium]